MEKRENNCLKIEFAYKILKLRDLLGLSEERIKGYNEGDKIFCNIWEVD